MASLAVRQMLAQTTNMVAFEVATMAADVRAIHVEWRAGN